MLAHIQYEDCEIADFLISGFSLLGPIPESGVFPKKPLYATLHEEQIRDLSPMVREAIYHSFKRPTMKWLLSRSSKPPCQIDMSELPSRACLTRRFGVAQGSVEVGRRDA